MVVLFPLRSVEFLVSSLSRCSYSAKKIDVNTRKPRDGRAGGAGADEPPRAVGNAPRHPRKESRSSTPLRQELPDIGRPKDDKNKSTKLDSSFGGEACYVESERIGDSANLLFFSPLPVVE